MNQDYQQATPSLVFYALAGSIPGISALIVWYFVLGPLGFKSASDFGIYIPFTNFQLHHEIIGIIILGLGSSLMIAGDGAIRNSGAFLFGMGTVIFADDILQHCTSSSGWSCTNWP